jgi:hypothetical protein
MRLTFFFLGTNGLESDIRFGDSPRPRGSSSIDIKYSSRSSIDLEQYIDETER